MSCPVGRLVGGMSQPALACCSPASPERAPALRWVRTPVRQPGLSDAWAWQGNTGRLIGPDMRMRSRAPVGQAG